MMIFISNMGGFRIAKLPSKAQQKHLRGLRSRKTMALSEIIEDQSSDDESTLNLEALRPGARNLIDSMHFAQAESQNSSQQDKFEGSARNCEKQLQVLFSSCSHLSSLSEVDLFTQESNLSNFRISCLRAMNEFLQSSRRKQTRPADLEESSTQNTFFDDQY